MMLTSIRGGQMPAASSIKKYHQPSFKGNIVEKPAKQDQKEGMTTEQMLGLGLGVGIALVAIGLIEWACSKKKKSKVVENVKLTVQQQQVEDLNDRLEEHFVPVTLKKYNPKWEMIKVVPNVLAPFESKNDFQLYEMKTLVPQLYGRKAQMLENKYIDIENELTEKELFVEYLKLRSEYYEKENEFDVVRSEVLKNPSEDVVDVETLRLHMLANNTFQFLYSDDSVEEPHDMSCFVQPLLIANCAAKILEEFKPKKENLSENEKKYFEYMNKLGKFWHERLKKEASEKLSKFTKIITGEVEAPKCYTKGEAKRDDKRHIFFLYHNRNGFKLLYMLSHEAKAKWREVMDKRSEKEIGDEIYTRTPLDIQIRILEGKFWTLKDAVAYN